MPNMEQSELMKLPIQDRRKIIRHEVDRRIKEDHGFEYLNNFYCNLPDGLRRKTCERLGIMGTIYENFLLQGGSTVELSHTSDLMRSQTPRQFFETIDATMNEMGIPLDEFLMLQHNLTKLMSEHISPNSEEIEAQMAILNKIYLLTLPLFVELRAKGYSWTDLAA